jgi:hypothetical protein
VGVGQHLRAWLRPVTTDHELLLLGHFDFNPCAAAPAAKARTNPDAIPLLVKNFKKDALGQPF